MNTKHAKPLPNGCQCEHLEPCTDPVKVAGRFCADCYEGLTSEYWAGPHRIMFNAARILNWPMRPVEHETLPPHPHEERKFLREDWLQLNVETLLNQSDEAQLSETSSTARQLDSGISMETQTEKKEPQHGLVYLRVKIKSLAEESRIIRTEERRAFNNSHLHLVDGLTNHRKYVVRKASRETLLAYGYLRGRPYSKVESLKSDLRLFDWKGVARMVVKYGPGGSLLYQSESAITATINALHKWASAEKQSEKQVA